MPFYTLKKNFEKKKKFEFLSVTNLNLKYHNENFYLSSMDIEYRLSLIPGKYKFTFPKYPEKLK